MSTRPDLQTPLRAARGRSLLSVFRSTSGAPPAAPEGDRRRGIVPEHGKLLVLLGGGVLAALLVAGFVAARWLAAGEVGLPAGCSEEVGLVPVVRSGPLWERHRHWLAGPGWYEGSRRGYVIENRRTGQAFRWDFYRRRAGGYTWFAVPTRYAEIVNRGWRDDPWAFCRLPAPPALEQPLSP